MNAAAERLAALTSVREGIRALHKCSHGNVCEDEVCNLWWDCIAVVSDEETKARNDVEREVVR